MIWGLIAWIVVGGLAGWVASLIMGTNARQGCLMNVIVGIVGAFIGGLLVNLIGGNVGILEFNITSFIVAVVGAVILLFILRAIRGRSV